MSGWIKIHRDIAKHWISQDMEKLGRWLDLLILASYEDNKVLVGDKLIEVKRGQMIASCDFLAKRWGCSKSTVSKFLELLESDNMVERYTERKITKLTICNYDSYQQSEDNASNDIPNDYRTIAERLPNELKKLEEIQEINNNNLNARTREERVSWDDGREKGFAEQIKANQIMAIGRKFSLNRPQVIQFVGAFLDKCQIGDHGHRDIGHFGNHLCNFIDEELKKPKPIEQPKARKVIEGQEIFNLYK